MNNYPNFSSPTKRIKRLYFIGVLFVICAAAAGLLLGSTLLSPATLLDALSDGFESSTATRIFGYVRLPRTAAALLCGGALAVAGAVIQGVLANRLASPSIVGVNAGAGLAVTLCTALGLYGGWQVSAFSFLGAFGAVLLVAFGARKWGTSRGTVILIGVAMNSLLGALTDTVTTFLPEVGVMSNDFRIGEFSAVTYQRLIPAAILIPLAVLIILSLRNELNILTLGGDTAKGLGLNPNRMSALFLILAALLAGCAVSLAGLLSFVGLIVPHAIRRLAGGNTSHLPALCALYGAGFVCLCDTLARTVFS
ncbi:MAG: iron ABC transporter permease, partial [Clostridia bacterium]|nr:iron ABC transporter permease [Clostridia bacterium]